MFGVKGKKSNGVHKAPGRLAASILAGAEPPPAPAACNGHGRCSGFGTGVSHTCFVSSCLSSSNPDCARITHRFPWQSTHICFSTTRASPSEIQQAQFPSPPIHRQISLPLLIMIWKLVKTTCLLSAKRVLPHYRGKRKEDTRKL